jgi:hypothetical protein
VSTPSHLNQSSPPRSVPSPVTSRNPAGKTPVNHPTGSSSHGSKTVASTPMVQNLSQTGNTASPSANVLSFGTPSGRGLDAITPAGLNMATPSLGAAAMMPSMSELGLTASGGRRNEDEERRLKMRRVLKAIGKPKGRVSEEGIARISRRVGFANDIDAEKLTPEEKERKAGNRPISTAGNTIVIEIDLKHQVPQNVQVAYSVQTKALDEQGEKASKVLLNDLKADGAVALQAKLDRFALNLERLARLDRLSSSHINCFEALSGIYTSLRRLYDQENATVKAHFTTEEKADAEVTNHKSGKPVIHEGSKLGLALQYWTSGGASANVKENSDASHMDVDGQTDSKSEPRTEDDDRTFALSIEVEASSANLFPSLRISDAWLPESLDLSDPSTGIPWQEPAPTLLPANMAGDAMTLDGQQRLPDLRFVARPDPPLVMPYQTAMNVLAAVGVTQAPMLEMPPTQYAALALDLPSDPLEAQQGMTFSTTTKREVISRTHGQETTVEHCYTLNSAKLDWGFMLEEIPFSHPRQLVELLPTLRQWAYVTSLLRGTVKPKDTSSVSQPTSQHFNGNGTLTIESLMEDIQAEESAQAVPITIALGTTPNPTLALAFPAPRNGSNATLSLHILPNAQLSISSQQGLALGDEQAVSTKLPKLAKALEVCGDLGVWLEWLRTTLTA